MIYTTLKRVTKPLVRLLVIFLVFIFFITPLSPVFADISTDTSVLQDTESVPTSDSAFVPANSSDNENPPSDKNTPLSSPLLSNTPAQPVSNGKNIPEPDPFTGALTYIYPISVPPGRNNMQPDLKLQYNSQDVAQDNIFGFGWSINIPYIARVNKKGTNTLFTDNYFYSSLSGDLVNVSSNNYASKVENGDFLKYVFSSNTWVVTDKSGVVYTFGSQSSSREDNNGDAAKIYKWMLETVQDTNGNIITYTYTKDQNKIYPLNIHYAIFDVNFSKEARLDNTTSYASSFGITTNYRISQIQITVSGTIRNQYNFSYTAGDNGKRSLLQSVTQTGYDISGLATTLPATVFSYTLHQGDIFDINNSQPVNGLSTIGDTSKGIIAGNVDSDAYPDIVKAYEFLDAGTSDKKIYVFNPATNSFYVSTNYTVPSGIINYSDSSYTPNDGGTRLLDINGDGKNDLMRTPYTYSPSAVADKEINNGNGWTQIPNTDPKYSVDYVSNPNYTLFSSDVNGDELIDYIQDSGAYLKLPENQIWYNTKTSLNNGNGFNYYTTIDNHGGTGTQSYAYTPTFIGSQEFLMFDINGDNLPDIIQSTGNYNGPTVQKVYINNGNFWQLDTSYVLPSNFTYFYNGQNGSSNSNIQIADFNNDGLQDLLTLGGNLYINQGKSFINSPLSNDMMALMGYSVGGGNLYPDYLFFDINADGTPDFMRLNGKYVWFDTATTHADLLKSITLSTGGKSDITYKSSAQYKDASNNLLNPNLSFVVQTVNTITTTDLVNNISSTNTYAYAGGYYYYDATDPFTRKFAGFGTITKTDSLGNITKNYLHQGDASNASQGEYNDEYWKIGKTYRSEAFNNSGNLYAKTINKWDSVDLGNSVKFVKLSQTVNSTYDGGVTHRDTAESYTYDNANGNVTQKIQWGQVSGNDDSTFVDTGTDKFTTDYSYASDGAYIVGLSSQSTTIDQNSNKVKESKFYYDSLTFGNVIKGNITRQEDLKSGVTYINSQKAYNSYGLVVTSTDPNNNTTTYAYDINNLYPATITNALSQNEQYIYDYAFGQVIQKTDINGRVFQYTYDGLGRPLYESQPDLTVPSTLVTKATYTYTDTLNAVSVKKSNYLDASNIVDSYTYFDGLARKIQERAEGEGSNFSVKDYAYNNLGQLQKESLPYFSSGFTKTSPTTDATLYTNYTYDSMGRVTAAINSVGTTINAYNNWKLTTTDANNNIKDVYKDAYGYLVQVDEHNGGNTYSTFYNYNYLQNVIKITDALNNVRNFTYDNLGRKLTAEDLHNLGDTTFGTWTYTCDNAGNVTQTIDPKNQTINYTYDNLNRELTEDYVGQAGIEVTNTYDQGTDGKGQLTGTISPSLTQTNTYNALGSIKSESKIINSITYLTTYDYDRQQNQINVTNPDNSQIKNIYNSGGALEQVQRKESTDGSFINVVTNFDYLPTGQITLQNYANGATTTNTYDATKLYRPVTKVTTIAGGVHGQDLSYTYDSVGNITKIIDASSGATAKTSNYTYDNLNRLTSAVITNVASGQTPYTQNFTYDAIANILTKIETIGTNPAINYTYTYAGNTGSNYANPHAVTSITDGTTATNYVYDNNGNMTQDGAKSYVFDYNNRLIQSSTVSSPVTSTFYPITGDGSIYYNNSKSWSTAHNAPDGNVATYTTPTLNTNSGKYNAIQYNIERAFLPFNTASLPDNASISVAKLKVYVESKMDNDNDGDDWITVVQSSEPNTNALTIADYDLAGNPNNPIEGNNVFERKDLTNITTGQYLVFNLNSTGISWISKTASTKLGLREGHDAINSAFVGGASQYDQLKIRSSEYIGTSSDPLLEVTYTTPTVTNYAYDSLGQRIKLSNATATTYYPTKLYNTDGTTTTKHFFAGTQDIGTIQGSGAGATVYYATIDSLNSSSIMTDSADVIAETLDYFPFGSLRIDNKVGTFNEQRKYIGQEYDTDTGLNYLNARYYNSVIGRFISQDQMFWNFDGSWLADPQNQNSYAYARNNPIVSSDPSGLLTLYNPGTFTSEKSAQNSDIVKQIGKTFNEPVTVFSQSKGWSGADTDYARQVGGQKEADFINNYHFTDGEKLNIVGHSHGGNVAFITSQLTNHKIDNLVTLGTPIRDEYKPNLSNINNFVNVYSNGDSVQNRLGGRNVSDAVKLFSFLTVNPILFGLSSFFETGTAGRTMNGAQNIEAKNAKGDWISAHGGLLNPSIWNEYVKDKIK